MGAFMATVTRSEGGGESYWGATVGAPWRGRRTAKWPWRGRRTVRWPWRGGVQEGTGGGPRGPKDRTGWRVAGLTRPEFEGKLFSE
jgi:hypothetical protein